MYLAAWCTVMQLHATPHTHRRRMLSIAVAPFVFLFVGHARLGDAGGGYNERITSCE